MVPTYLAKGFTMANKTAHKTAATTPAPVATTPAPVTTAPAPVTTAPAPVFMGKYTHAANAGTAQNTTLQAAALTVASKHCPGGAWAMPTHGNAAGGACGKASALWLAAYAANGNKTPTVAQAAQALLSFAVAVHATIKGGRGASYAGAHAAVASGAYSPAAHAGLVAAAGYIFYSGKKTKGKVNLLQN